jgi:SAM-dependent methyltransferase
MIKLAHPDPSRYRSPAHTLQNASQRRLRPRASPAMSEFEMPYDREFYIEQMDGSFASAMEIVPIVLDLFAARSVCDVGCGVGTWLASFGKHGVADLLGLDGDYVDRALLRIPAAQFRPTDLAQPVRLERTFDLAISLEVAEHLAPARAEGFVSDLTRLAPAVLFSAAVPKQGGRDHVNERWQSWWAEIFRRHGYVTCDVVRSRIWDNPNVNYCYRQNTILYVRQGVLETRPELNNEVKRQLLVKPPLDIVHPICLDSAGNLDTKLLLLKKIWWSVNRDLRKPPSRRRFAL